MQCVDVIGAAGRSLSGRMPSSPRFLGAKTARPCSSIARHMVDARAPAVLHAQRVTVIRARSDASTIPSPIGYVAFESQNASANVQPALPRLCELRSRLCTNGSETDCLH